MLYSGEAIFFLLALAASVATKPSLAEFEKVSANHRIFNYDEYLENFNKHPSPIEMLNRARIFLIQTTQIFYHNIVFLQKGSNYHLNQNQFTDMTWDELKRDFASSQGILFSDADADASTDGDTKPKASEKESTVDPVQQVREPAWNDKALEGVIKLLESFKSADRVAEVVDLRADQSADTGRLSDKDTTTTTTANKSNREPNKLFANLLNDWKRDFYDYAVDEGIIDLRRKKRARLAELGERATVMKIDWRITGCINEPKQQGTCNACYAFTVLSLLEYYYCRRNEKLLPRFSAQHVLDCGKPFGMRGCQGGRVSSVGTFVKTSGLQLESDIPYTGQEGHCLVHNLANSGKATIKPEFSSWLKVDDWLSYARRGPLIVGLNMPADFFSYGGGIHDGTKCDPSAVHAMLLIGYGIHEGKEFWVLQNSYSMDWGEKGYFRILKDSPAECFNTAIFAQANFNHRS